MKMDRVASSVPIVTVHTTPYPYRKVYMEKSPKNLLDEKVDIEDERQILGQALYHVKDELPSFVLNKDEPLELAAFMGWIRGFHVMCDQFGGDISSLFAELTFIYDIKEAHDIKDEQKNAVRLAFLILRGLLGHAFIQSHQIIEAVNDWKEDESAIEDFEVKGNDYYFIPLVLNNLFYYYNSLIIFFIKRRYLNPEFIDSIRERLNYLISPGFEDMRRSFKVVECFEIKRLAEENKITLH